jgi:hypothetical protein
VAEADRAGAEDIQSGGSGGVPPGSDADPWSGWAFDAEGRLVDISQPLEVIAFGPPPPVRWASPDDLGSVSGRRCAVVGRDQTTYDLRVVSEVFESNGGRYLNVVFEDQWYRWQEAAKGDRPEHIPRATCVATRHVWIEYESPTRGHEEERTEP